MTTREEFVVDLEKCVELFRKQTGQYPRIYLQEAVEKGWIKRSWVQDLQIQHPEWHIEIED